MSVACEHGPPVEAALISTCLRNANNIECSFGVQTFASNHRRKVGHANGGARERVLSLSSLAKLEGSQLPFDCRSPDLFLLPLSSGV